MQLQAAGSRCQVQEASATSPLTLLSFVLISAFENETGYSASVSAANQSECLIRHCICSSAADALGLSSAPEPANGN